jgi:phosphoesterase RecJ-like protein
MEMTNLGSIHSIPLFEEQIKKANTIAIMSHMNPDSDALGSLICLKEIISNKYKQKEVDIFIDCERVDCCNEKMLVNSDLNNKRFDTYDLAMVVDCPTLSRVGKYSEIFNKAKDTSVVDHHSTSEYFANNNIVIKYASSTCEVIYLLSKILDYEYR